MNDFNNNNNQLDESLLVNFALSLQKRTKVDISAQELSDFISNNADKSLRLKVLAALNHSPDLMQQWLDINNTLGFLKSEQTTQSADNSGFMARLMHFVTRPWLIPVAAMALAVVVFMPQLMQANSQDLLNEIYAQLPPSQYESKGFTPMLDDSIPTSQKELFDNSVYLGSKHWRYYKQNHEMLELPDLCQNSSIKHCKKIQTIAVQLGKIRAIVESSCYKLDDSILWDNITQIGENLNQEINNLSLDFTPQMPDLTQAFCD